MLALALVGALLEWPAPAGAQPAALAPPSLIDGPSQAIDSLGAIAVSRDGTGGIVYLKDVAGVAHVFVSRLVGGVFAPPEQVDAALAGSSSSPVLAADDRGVLLVAFINAGALYVTDRLGTPPAWKAPLRLIGAASNPALSMSDFGKAYLAFTEVGTGGHDVRAAYYQAGNWALESAPLDADPAANAGTGEGRPVVGAAGDGVGVVAWGEAGHVYTRRVWGTSPSVVFERADPATFAGAAEVGADQPALGVGGNSSYVDVGFRETLQGSGWQQSRVLVRRLRGSQYEDVEAGDGLAAGAADGAAQPRIASDEFGEGMLTDERSTSNAVYSMRFGNNGFPGRVGPVDSRLNLGAAFAVPAQAGYHDNLVAWQQDPGSAGPADIRVRFYDGSSFGPELVASSPDQGASFASSGLGAAGDISADVAIAWIQGSGADTQLVAAQLYQPPGAPAPARFHYVRSAQSVLSWSAGHEEWPPIEYAVTLDGAPIAQTAARSLTTAPLADGPHTWTVTESNRAGLTSGTSSASFWVDTVAPALTISLSGTPHPGWPIHLAATYTDAPPPEPPAAASGIAQVVVNWGDGKSTVITHGKYHVYAQPGRYVITVTAADHAGNVTTARRTIRVRPKPKPKHRRKRGHR
jgi:PKD domain